MNDLTMTKSQWKQYLQEAHGDTEEAMREEARRLLEYRDYCNSVSGGSEFASTVHEWTGYSPATASKMMSVYLDDQLFSIAKKLPKDFETRYLISTIPASDRVDLPISPSLTRQQVKNWKKYGSLEAPVIDVEEYTVEDAPSLEEAAMLIPPLEAWGLTALGKRAYEQERDRIQKALTQIAKSQSKKFVDTLIDVLRFNQDVFRKELIRQIPDAIKARQKALDDREHKLNLREKAIVGGISEKDRKLILSVLHPDRAPEGMREKYVKAFQAFKEVAG